MPAVTCPTCHRPFAVADAYAGHVVSCPACRRPLTVPHAYAPPAAPESPFGGIDEAADGRPARYERAAARRSSNARIAVWGCALVPILFLVAVLFAAFFRIIPGGISDLGIVAFAALIGIVVAVAFVVDRMVGG